MLAQPSSIQAIRFQYSGRLERRGNWETMPFYLNHLRRFLIERDGQAVWLKGNTGGDEAAYLIFDSAIRDHVRDLLNKPLLELGVYEIAAELEPVEVLRKYYRDAKIGVGRLQVWEEQVGEEILDHITEVVRKGFWYAPIGTPTGAIFLKAQRLTNHWHENEPWLCFHETEELICRSDGTPVGRRSSDELWLRLSALDTLADLERRMVGVGLA